MPDDGLSPGALSLGAYNDKRDFNATSEPPGEYQLTGQSRFVIQKHIATRTHFDLRLEHDGRLLSWAITKGPSLTPADKRLAVRTEDHPTAYIDFEGVITQGYGKGRMIVWDCGTFVPVTPLDTGLPKGEIKFILQGHRLNGQFALVLLKEKGKTATAARQNWLLVKDRDAYATDAFDAAELFTTSVVTGLEPHALIRAGAAVGEILMNDGNEPLPLALATSASEPPPGDAWVHEIKYDGYRVQIDTRDGLVMLTRKGLNWTHRYPGAVEQLVGIPQGCVFDGEVIAIAANGLPTFTALRADLEVGGHRTTVKIFDVLIARGRDVRHEPLLARRLILRNLLAETRPEVVVEFIVGEGASVFRQAAALGLEGVVSKRRGTPYPQGRTSDWLKVKHSHVDAFLVGGYRRSTTRGRPFASLLLGTPDDSGVLIYRGRVGSGFDDRALSELWKLIKPLMTEEHPFETVPGEVKRDAVWLAPELAIQVEFAGLTGGSQVRHARYLGLRDDVESVGKIDTAVPALPKPVVRVTSPNDIVDELSGRTKRDVVAYYQAMARVLEESAGRRPLTILRAPYGTAGETFFQRNASTKLPKGVQAIRGLAALKVDDPLGFARLAQNRMLEVHIMASTLAFPDTPDRLVFDLDPDEGVEWSRIVGAAELLKAVLQAVGLEPKLIYTGGKGLHLVCDITAPPTWETFTAVAKGLATDLSAAEPQLFTASASKAKRKGRIYLDWMRNRRGATAVAPWSLRARPGLPVARPIQWSDLKSGFPSVLSLEEAVAKASSLAAAFKPTDWPNGLETRYLKS